MGIRRSEELVVSEFKKDDEGNPTGGRSYLDLPREPGEMSAISVFWQDGIVGDEGQTGAFVEDLIEMARQRMQFFQSTRFNCRENAVAITKLEEALMWLDWRTRKRVTEGVENTYELHRPPPP